MVVMANRNGCINNCGCSTSSCGVMIEWVGLRSTDYKSVLGKSFLSSSEKPLIISNYLVGFTAFFWNVCDA